MTQPGGLPIPDGKGMSYVIQRSPNLRNWSAAALIQLEASVVEPVS